MQITGRCSLAAMDCSTFDVPIGEYDIIVYPSGESLRSEDLSGVNISENADLVDTIAGAPSGSNVFVSVGDYSMSESLVVPSGCTLRFHPGACVKPTSDFDVVKIKSGGVVLGAFIDASSVAGFSSACIAFAGSDHIDFKDYTRVSNVKILLPASTGTGIKFFSNESESSGYVTGVHLDGARIRGGNIALEMEIPGTPAAQNWINGNQISNVWAAESVTFISLARDIYYTQSINGNTFAALQFQPKAGITTTGLYCNGSQNQFHGLHIWDWNLVNNAHGIWLGSYATRNYIIHPLDESYCTKTNEKNLMVNLESLL